MATELEVLAEGYALEHRAVSTKEKHKVYRRYDIDHLIPLSLGGSNDLRNLWPHPYHETYGPRAKARLECKLRTLVKSHILPLKEAQRKLRENWVQAMLELLV